MSQGREQSSQTTKADKGMKASSSADRKRKASANRNPFLKRMGRQQRVNFCETIEIVASLKPDSNLFNKFVHKLHAITWASLPAKFSNIYLPAELEELLRGKDITEECLNIVRRIWMRPVMTQLLTGFRDQAIVNGLGKELLDDAEELVKGMRLRFKNPSEGVERDMGTSVASATVKGGNSESKFIGNEGWTGQDEYFTSYADVDSGSEEDHAN